MRITLFDYGAGNLHSLSKALRQGGDEVRASEDPVAALDTDLLVLPGVGAFGAAAARLAPALERVRQAIAGGLPCLGICLGMQLLFERSEEGEGQGLGVLPGAVTRLGSERVPHIGWNSVEGAGIEVAYYAHSFACRPRSLEDVVAWTTHEVDRFPAIVRRGRTVGIQFHPEKSSAAGVRLLRAFVEELRP
jgi:imidazole glycerol-phosphate synthase subunit HisH